MSRRPKSPAPTPGALPPEPSSDARATWFYLLLFAVALVAYLPALSAGFIWDDSGHVTRADLRDLAGLGRIWFELGATQQYYPVLHSAFWLEHHLWGDAPTGYHLLNILLHALNACLFARLLHRLALPGAWFAALLFALHPVCVESVAWISEQKNTLSTAFYLGAALAYLRFDVTRRPAPYVTAAALFLLALLSKSVTASLPAALLVIQWWRHGRLEWRRDAFPLLPWFALAAGAGLVTTHFERTFIGAHGADFALSALDRLVLAGRIFWFYLGKLVWPAELIFIYPRWTIAAGELWQWLFLLGALALVAGLLVLALRRHRRGPLAAALLFGGTLFPALGFFEVFPFLFSYVADHFQYLASLAFFAAAGAALLRATARWPRTGAIAAGSLLLASLGALTWAQARHYRDVFTLYETTLARNPACWMAHQNLAVALVEAGRTGEAIPHLEDVLRLKPGHAPAENNLGDCHLRLGRVAQSLPHFERAVQLEPRYAVAHANLGQALARLGRLEEAERHFAEATRLDPAAPSPHYNWGVALMMAKRFEPSLPHLTRAVELAPRWADARVARGRVFASLGEISAAATEFHAAVELAPTSAEAHLLLARALQGLGRASEAEPHFRSARELGARTP